MHHINTHTWTYTHTCHINTHTCMVDSGTSHSCIHTHTHTHACMHAYIHKACARISKYRGGHSQEHAHEQRKGSPPKTHTHTHMLACTQDKSRNVSRAQTHFFLASRFRACLCVCVRIGNRHLKVADKLRRRRASAKPKQCAS
jgi:hypothetical protein